MRKVAPFPSFQPTRFSVWGLGFLFFLSDLFSTVQSGSRALYSEIPSTHGLASVRHTYQGVSTLEFRVWGVGLRVWRLGFGVGSSNCPSEHPYCMAASHNSTAIDSGITDNRGF